VSQDIEERFSLDERTAADFVLTLRKRWADTVYPQLVTEAGSVSAQPETVEDAERLLPELSVYPWFSQLERAQQKMLWRLGAEAVTRLGDDLVADPEERSALPCGTLQLDAQLALPDWYTEHDVHLQPGGVYSDDLSARVYEFGARVVMLRDNDGFKFHQLFVDTALPAVSEPRRIVDMGCGFGKSTEPLALRYPDAEVMGVDLAAPGLRLAHANASARGLAVHYRQADIRRTGLDTDSCDIVTGTMVLHEMPSSAIKQAVQEAARVLKPGGVLRFLEFQPTGEPVRDATIYQHAERNNEPFFRDLFGTDVAHLCQQAGLTNAAWTPFDERASGLSPAGWGSRSEWHFPWAVLSAAKPPTS
jgi:ubiquinone/menaquinone biosynthesis C-methylase UbiE